MSRRDVDLEFEKAYQRLFSTSSAPTADQADSPATVSTPVSQAGLSKASHRPQHPPRPAVAAGPSTPVTAHHQLHKRHDVPAYVTHRQALAGRAHTSTAALKQVQKLPVKREKTVKPPASAFRPDALPRLHPSATAKGKQRVPSFTERQDHRSIQTRPSTSMSTTASAQPAMYAPQGSVAYYPYTQAHAPFPYSGPVVGPAMTALPNQAVAWSQPMVSAGPVPTITYPGFSASVTFSQPQFFTPHPSQMQANVTPLSQDTWPSAVAPPSTHPPQASGSQSISAQVAPPIHRPSPATIGHPASSKGSPLPASAEARSTSLKARGRDDLPSIARAAAGPRVVAAKTAKPLLDENGMRIPRKRGRPRTRHLLPEQDEAQIKTTAAVDDGRSATRSPSAAPGAVGPTRFDGCLPLREHAGPPTNRETHTLFIHASRRLAWMARRAVAQAGVVAEVKPAASPAPVETRSWARWSNSIAARLHGLSAGVGAGEREAVVDEAVSSCASQSQPDPAGLFPRERRREYVALRKRAHAAARTATLRLSLQKLCRYLVRTADKARREQHAQRQAYLEHKLRPAKINRHLTRARRPHTLDARALWSHWASTKRPHAAPLASVKLEPDQASVKAEASGDVDTPPLPDLHAAPAKRRAPLLLRRNFRVYALVGLHDLPLA